jgi:hypothetical protein
MSKKSIKISQEAYLQIEQMRLMLIMRGKTTTKSGLLDCIISIHSKNLVTGNEKP